MSVLNKRLAVLLWLTLIHAAGIYLFTNGFLLSRLSLSNRTTCDDGACTLPPTHNRLVVLIIDALRFDFVSPDPPEPHSPFHHNILTLPRELTRARPEHSFLYNSYADPPTTTLQRIKGITTGSLPTFVDLGNNFGASSIDEDSLIHQLVAAGKKGAFMGDDTWMSPNSTFPYDSFNVEDLHSVDEGVIRHLFPALASPTPPDFLVGHFLGVDHVGHRVGPDHPSMRDKLAQMNDVLARVIDALADDTLLVVLGDHGMDRAGDHGGDGTLETSAALWVYSKGVPLAGDEAPPSGLVDYATFPGAREPHRRVAQIDLVPSIALLLGLPIPFNSLGSVIPDLFAGSRLQRALEINTAQIKAYLDTYRASGAGGELDDAWPTIESAWAAAQSFAYQGDAHLITLSNFNRVALGSCRAIWAQFDPVRMGMGLALLAIGIVAAWGVYSSLAREGAAYEPWLLRHLTLVGQGAGVGAVASSSASVLVPSLVIHPLNASIFAAALASCFASVLVSPPAVSFRKIPGILILALHGISFFSNSFTFWEDRVSQWLLAASMVPFLRRALTAPTRQLRARILGWSVAFLACARLISVSTVCREEQQPYCHVTFYASSSLPEPPLPALLLALPAALIVPWALHRALRTSRSELGITPIVLIMLRGSLAGGTLHWLLEWADTAELLSTSIARPLRSWIARGALGAAALALTALWVAPKCVSMELVQPEPGSAPQAGPRRVAVLGYANSLGAPYLLFVAALGACVWLMQQLTGQLVLALFLLAVLAFLEAADAARDAAAMQAAFAAGSLPDSESLPANVPRVGFGEVVPLALLGTVAFFGTGHQAVLATIQWKAAFVLAGRVVYPWAPVSVVLNFFGAVMLAASAVPLLALWKRAPAQIGGKQAPAEKGEISDAGDGADSIGPDSRVKAEATLAGVGVMVYYAVLLFGAAVSAAVLRRHLMVWKVFAPRYMAAAAELLVVDISVVLGLSSSLYGWEPKKEETTRQLYGRYNQK
ncbi:uncharacterized protein SCHCODRAFT_02693304 [Schizophyllum commune H4-8]|uniref:uncharacterized protein n=1 Tax=Schizophyllum commune (strain H4-8 / FGSC 9210) TaxID=578458 RepID=UPI002160135A|nr:uncharacterized protein SCHCODRAFT_02693304 [Schizophyllum commune H4-8]KAI5886597.1 hypothetical protein SCHCODRAFT_02693304 [Schizophyllum commune H4-8]